MTLKDEILAGGFDLQNRDDGAIAAALSVGRTKITSRFVTARAVLAECENGATILDKLEAASAQISAVKWAMKFLQQEGGIDVAHPRTLGMIDQLEAGGVLTQTEADELKGMAVQPDPVTSQDVTHALEGI
jgi:hypothetical protein